jgi:outer membrane protein
MTLKMKNTLTVFAFLLLFSVSPKLVSAQTKIAHVNMQTLIQALPEYKKAETQLQDFAKSLQDLYSKMQDEYGQKVDTYVKDSSKMSKPERDIKRQEIQDLAARMQKLEQTSDQQLSDKQNELLKPMQDKVMAGIKSAAKENGYSYVFDTSQGSNLVYYPESDDLTDTVKKKLTAAAPASTPGK